MTGERRAGRNGCYLQACLDLLIAEAPETYARFVSHLSGTAAAFCVGNERFWLFSAPGQNASVGARPPEDVSLEQVDVRMKTGVLVDLVDGKLKSLEALHDGRFDIKGPPEPVLRLGQAFSLALQRGIALPSFRKLYKDYKEGRPAPHQRAHPPRQPEASPAPFVAGNDGRGPKSTPTGIWQS